MGLEEAELPLFWAKVTGLRASIGGGSGERRGGHLVGVARTPTAPSARESGSPEAQGRHRVSASLAMNLEPPKAEIRSATRVTGGPVTPRKGPPKFKQRQTRQFKSKPPKKGVQGFGDDIPGMEGLGTDITVICPWEAFNHLELHELAQYGII
ncbi:PREDICTED: retinal rod rhodopsin-sensitive cGMP 3',5'-cyclic phosphodiesterase subunit gamma isoform X2 [Myotis brandtii]|nr:PREDICTED: retinal rod rhodopsin-sensitive cGMP 3',5'-cyclic phosphodiesterase subunit gamma isoform X2 [Myotis brandtii]